MSVAACRAITLDEITPEWLTEVLLRENALASGQVLAVERIGNPAFNSNVAHLKPIYSAQVGPTTPQRLLLKCSLKEAWAIRAGAREVAFYQQVKRSPNHPPVVVRCYDAIYDADSGKSHLLLEDLSESHVAPVTRDRQISLIDNLPSDIHLKEAVNALARFHAYWWQNTQLGTGIAQIGAWCSDEQHFAAETERRRRVWEALIADEADWFPHDLKVMYETILQQLPHLWRRYFQPRLATFSHLTLTHGDGYLANFLCPKEGQSGESYLIDWQSPEVYVGASDLVTMCATFWTREQRAEDGRERKVLEHYHRILQEHGVSGYAWGDLVRDYQYALVDWLLVPLQDRFEGSAKSYWWPKIQCLAQAFEDWNVSELFISG